MEEPVSFRRCLSILCCLIVLLVSRIAGANPGVPDCSTPRGATDTVFFWQQESSGRVDLDKAVACLERTGRNPKELKQSASRIKRVYDNVGAWLKVEQLSDDPAYLDPESRTAVVTPAPEKLPDVVVEKRGERWVWTAESLDWIDGYYDANFATLDKLVDGLPASLKKRAFGVYLWQYLALLLLVSLGLLARKIIRHVVLYRVKQVSEKLGQKWAGRLVDVFASPGATLITAILLRVGYPQLQLPVGLSKTLGVALRVLITLSIVWGVYRAVDLVGAKLAERAEKTDSKLDDQLIPLVRKSLKVVVFVIGTLVVLQNMDVNVTTLLTGLSIGSLAFALAAKDTLANLFGSLTIFVDNPFQIGDWINVSGIDGTVEEVGFRSTRIRTFYNSLVVIPNAKIADQKIDNYGQRQFRRCFVTLGLTYDTTPEQMQAFCEGARAVIRNNDYTRKDSYEVHMSGFGDSALEVMLYFFFECETWTDELRERHNVFLELMRLAQDLGVGFAFPTQTLHVDSMAHAGSRELSPPPEIKQLRSTVLSYGPSGKRGRPEGPVITESRFEPDSALGRGDQKDSNAGEGADGGA